MSSLRVRMIEDTRRLVIYGGIMVGLGPGTLRAILLQVLFFGGAPGPPAVLIVEPDMEPGYCGDSGYEPGP